MSCVIYNDPFLSQIYNPSSETNEDAREFCQRFINDTSRLRYIFGRNEYAKSIAALVDVDGFIDDFTEDREFLNKPIFKGEEIPKNSLVVSVVVGKVFTAKKRLENLKLEYLDYFSFFYHSNLKIKPVTCWEEFIKDFYTNIHDYSNIYSILNDEESKKTFIAIINFRISGNIQYMINFTDKQKEQYFEKFLLLLEDEIFIDVGGYNGDTTLEFIKHCPNYKSIHFFEPDRRNMSEAKAKLGRYPSITYHTVALSDKSGFCSFTSDGSCSRMEIDGLHTIMTGKLDDIITEPVSFIKMDIEGSEIDALKGAQEIIKRNHPKLAICAYHKGDDLRRIPQLILSYYNDYQIFIRHYTEGVDETVIFFIPNAEKGES